MLNSGFLVLHLEHQFFSVYLERDKPSRSWYVYIKYLKVGFGERSEHWAGSRVERNWKHVLKSGSFLIVVKTPLTRAWITINIKILKLLEFVGASHKQSHKLIEELYPGSRTCPQESGYHHGQMRVCDLKRLDYKYIDLTTA